MPGGHPYFLMVSPDFCERCNQPLCDHDRERVNRPNGRWGYEYFCPGGQPASVPPVEVDD